MYIAQTALAALLLGLVGCVEIPEQELATYAESYAQTRVAGDQLLDVAAPRFAPDAPAEGDKCDLSIDPKSGLRKCYTPELALGLEGARLNEPFDVRVRRAALRLIGEYNGLLVLLAAGESGSALKERVDQFTDFVTQVGGVVPQAAAPVATATALIDLILPIADKLERLRASNAAARSVVEAQPDVSALIRGLIADSATLYDLQVGHLIEQYNIKDTELEIARASEDAEATAEIEAEMTSIKAQGEAFEEALNAYVRSLDQSKKALAELAAAIRTQSGDPAASMERLVRQATAARLMADELIVAVRKLNIATAK